MSKVPHSSSKFAKMGKFYYKYTSGKNCKTCNCLQKLSLFSYESPLLRYSDSKVEISIIIVQFFIKTNIILLNNTTIYREQAYWENHIKKLNRVHNLTDAMEIMEIATFESLYLKNGDSQDKSVKTIFVDICMFYNFCLMYF